MYHFIRDNSKDSFAIYQEIRYGYGNITYYLIRKKGNNNWAEKLSQFDFYTLTGCYGCFSSNRLESIITKYFDILI